MIRALAPMPSNDSLLARIRGEYREMPGLRLTLSQASRLWHIDAATCQALLDGLVAEGFLRRTPDNAYMAFPAIRPAPAKAALRSEHQAGASGQRRS